MFFLMELGWGACWDGGQEGHDCSRRRSGTMIGERNKIVVVG